MSVIARIESGEVELIVGKPQGLLSCLDEKMTDEVLRLAKIGSLLEKSMEDKAFSELMGRVDGPGKSINLKDLSDLVGLAKYGQAMKISKGLKLIAIERQRQINDLGYTVDHDQEWVENELAIAAACYAVEGTEAEVVEKDLCTDAWPFGGKYDKRQEHDEVKRQIIAGALIVAEIDRLLTKGGSDRWAD
jgi:hypothetical protein